MEQLFESEPEPTRPAGAPPGAPLAARMRPTALDEVVGQQHLLGRGAALRAALEAGEPHSMILHGPPGTGKTTIARLVASSADAAFEELSAVEAGRAEVRAVLERARERRRGGRRTVFFLDEIHRFNKAQQDALLPAVEEGLVVLVGATTENPYFEVNSALISRARVYELQPLAPEHLRELLDRAPKRLPLAPDAAAFLAERTDGDARMALNALEVAEAAAARAGDGAVALAHAEQALQRRAIRYDRAGDQHYDLISAWIKSTRGSDPDASLYYLVAMLEGGEDPRFIARRMVILASEDVGNADPRALVVATSAAAAVEHVGMPEAAYALGQCAIYLALAPKSDAVGRALAAARRALDEHGLRTPPAAIRTAAGGAGRPLGRGVGYETPHRAPGHVNDAEHLPEGLEHLRLYAPDDAEPALRDRLAELRRARGRPT